MYQKCPICERWYVNGESEDKYYTHADIHSLVQIAYWMTKGGPK